MKNTTDHLKVEIIKLYQIDKLSLVKISKKFNLSVCAIRNCLKRNNIFRRTLSEAARVYTLNQNYFEKIDTINKAQILGMIYADGCLSERSGNVRVLTISLKEPDDDYLEFIKNNMKYSGGIRNFLSKYNNIIYVLSITSKKLFDDMVKLGLTPRKSLTVDFPTTNSVPEHLQSHFIRGYMEGDGSISTGYSKKKGRGRFLQGTVSFCGTLQFLEKIQEIVKDKLGINSNIYQKKQLKERNINSHSLKIDGNLQVLKFLDWIYSGYKQDFDFVMPRKYQKYLELKENWEHKESIQDQLKEEFRQKMSEITKGRIVSVETREKCRAGNLIYSKLHRYKEVWLQNKQNEIYHVRGIKYFCKEFNLPYTYFCAAINPNNTKNKSCHGWSIYNFDSQNPPSNYTEKFY